MLVPTGSLSISFVDAAGAAVTGTCARVISGSFFTLDCTPESDGSYLVTGLPVANVTITPYIVDPAHFPNPQPLLKA